MTVPAGTTREQLLASFSVAVFRQQPLRVAASIARDAARLFALTRDGNPEIPSIARWQFQVFYPTYPPRFTMTALTELARPEGGGGNLVTVRPVAALLRDYQLHGGYTPGPLYAVALAAGLLGALSGRWRRQKRTAAERQGAAACALVTLFAVVLLLCSDAFEFSWRYQLPAVVLLPAAGALGLTVLASRVTAVRTATAGRDRRTPPASAASDLRAPAAR